MADQSALDVVVAYTEAWAGKDLETAAAYLAADVVFDGASARHESAEPLLRGLAGFVTQIAPGWRQIAAVAQDEQVMVRDGKIRSETLVYDTLAVQTARAEAVRA